MKRFYERYSESDSKLQRSVAVLPWRHNLLLVEKVNEDKEVLFYMQKVLENGWTRDLLLNHLKAGAYHTKNSLTLSKFQPSIVRPADFLYHRLQVMALMSEITFHKEVSKSSTKFCLSKYVHYI